METNNMQLNNGSWFTTRTIEPMVFNSIDTENVRVIDTNINDLSIHKLNHFYTTDECIKRLILEASKHDLIVAFDFDNTLYKYNKDTNILKYDNNINNIIYKDILDILLECQNLNMILILYTVEENKAKIKEKVNFCKELGLNIKYINKSPIFEKSGKMYYNILLDDRAGLSDAYNQLSEVIKFLKQHKQENNIDSSNN